MHYISVTPKMSLSQKRWTATEQNADVTVAVCVLSNATFACHSTSAAVAARQMATDKLIIDADRWLGKCTSLSDLRLSEISEIGHTI